MLFKIKGNYNIIPIIPFILLDPCYNFIYPGNYSLFDTDTLNQGEDLHKKPAKAVTKMHV